MSKQLHQRIALPLLRHVLETFNAGAMTSEQACSELCLSRSRLFAIRKESFERFGLPLQIYVDQASFFKSQDGRHLTRLASRLKFYGVTLVFANSPESKGKIERRHQIWQDRLPAHFARIGVPSDLDNANSEIWPLVVWNSEMRQLNGRNVDSALILLANLAVPVFTCW